MDQLKLNAWKRDFENKVKELQIEFEAFLSPTQLSEFYEIELNQEKQSLVLKFINETGLPRELQNRIIKLYTSTKPKDLI